MRFRPASNRSFRARELAIDSSHRGRGPGRVARSPSSTSARTRGGWSSTCSSPGDWWKLTDEIFETVRIGAGLAQTGRLSDAGDGTRPRDARGVRALLRAPTGSVADDVHAVATSAIRDATNGERFLKAARAASGLNIEVISDEEEARFGYVAAINSSTMTDGVVLETGGGSMQLIEVADRRAESLRSFPLGAVRVTEEFLPGSGPAKKKDLQRVRAHVRNALSGYHSLAGAAAAASSAWEARCATSPPPRSGWPVSPTSACRGS